MNPEDEVTVVMTEAALRASPVWEAFTEEGKAEAISRGRIACVNGIGAEGDSEAGDTEPAPPPVEGEE